MAELADALDLKSNLQLGGAGSSPALSIDNKLKKNPIKLKL